MDVALKGIQATGKFFWHQDNDLIGNGTFGRVGDGIEIFEIGSLKLNKWMLNISHI